MPAKNTLKLYVQNGYYHLYNRGVEKRETFLDKQDYGVFLGYLKEYLLPKNEEELYKQYNAAGTDWQTKQEIRKILARNNFANEINLLAYCLMPNHFHLLIKQKSASSIDNFMRSLCTRYSVYFNRKHKRVGSLFQGVYKGVLVENDPQLLHLSRYIHKQAYYQGESSIIHPCSFPEYLGQRTAAWIKSKEILSFFSKTNLRLGYKSFVEENDTEEGVTLLHDLTLEEE